MVQGFLLNFSGSATATLTGLEPHETYYYEVFQYDVNGYANTNIITVNGMNEVTTNPSGDDPSTTGQISADENGQIIFTFSHVRCCGSSHIHLSGINVQQICGKYMKFSSFSDSFRFKKSVKCEWSENKKKIYAKKYITCMICKNKTKNTIVFTIMSGRIIDYFISFY